MGKTVLFGVDPQNDFGDPGGMLYCKGGYEIVGGGIVLIEYIAKQKGTICFSMDWHPGDSEHFKPIGPWSPHCVQGTWGAELLPGLLGFLNMKAGDFDCDFFLKGTQKNEHGYDPFEGKNMESKYLDEILGNPTEITIIVWGLATNFCVRAFVLTARRKSYKVYVVLDACRAVPTPDNPPPDFVTEEQAIEEMKTAGTIMTTVEEVINGRIV